MLQDGEDEVASEDVKKDEEEFPKEWMQKDVGSEGPRQEWGVAECGSVVWRLSL